MVEMENVDLLMCCVKEFTADTSVLSECLTDKLKELYKFNKRSFNLLE